MSNRQPESVTDAIEALKDTAMIEAHSTQECLSPKMHQRQDDYRVLTWLCVLCVAKVRDVLFAHAPAALFGVLQTPNKDVVEGLVLADDFAAGAQRIMRKATDISTISKLEEVLLANLVSEHIVSALVAAKLLLCVLVRSSQEYQAHLLELLTQIVCASSRTLLHTLLVLHFWWRKSSLRRQWCCQRCSRHYCHRRPRCCCLQRCRRQQRARSARCVQRWLCCLPRRATRSCGRRPS